MTVNFILTVRVCYFGYFSLFRSSSSFIRLLLFSSFICLYICLFILSFLPTPWVAMATHGRLRSYAPDPVLTLYTPASCQGVHCECRVMTLHPLLYRCIHRLKLTP
jgi:hypothetical protein